MRYSLLSYARCPVCTGALACFVAREVATPISPFVAERAARAPAAGQAFAPSPAFLSRAPLAVRLEALSGAAAPSRNREAEVEQGLLVCGECGRWFPILDSLPELLPDHLRDGTRDHGLLPAVSAGLPDDVRSMLRDVAADVAHVGDAGDTGVRYKRAEIGILSKIEDPAEFFGPGYSSPFNPGNTEFTLYLISLFANVVRLLGVKHAGAVVVDSGCGYAWTTEWLTKSGLESVGVDICRAYLEIGVTRMGPSRPHLIVADVENLPLGDAVADAVLAYESFHHIPDRARAMAGYARVLKDGGAAVLAEPGAAHEAAAVSVDVMAKFGILEKGMELADLEDYIAGSPFAPPEQHYVLHASTDDLERGISLPAAWRHSIFHGNVFRIRKDASRRAPHAAAARAMTSGAPVAGGDDTPGAVAGVDDLPSVHERRMRDWRAEQQRTIAELHAVTLDLHAAREAAAVATRTVADMKRSSFWKARQIWVWFAALFGSDRGGLRR